MRIVTVKIRFADTNLWLKVHDDSFLSHFRRDSMIFNFIYWLLRSRWLLILNPHHCMIYNTTIWKPRFKTNDSKISCNILTMRKLYRYFGQSNNKFYNRTHKSRNPGKRMCVDNNNCLFDASSLLSLCIFLSSSSPNPNHNRPNSSPKPPTNLQH